MNMVLMADWHGRKENGNMHSEILLTLARIYCDNEWAVAGKLPFPTEDGLGWVGLDYARLRWAYKHGYVERYARDGELRLNLTPEGRDALHVEELWFPYNERFVCGECGELRASWTGREGNCVDCNDSSLSVLWGCSSYIKFSGERDACGDLLPLPDVGA